ncbi:aminoglycoside phosphotransferase family protein [Nocardiopsis sp. LDBS1602]|nr:aminoglycoside phosphotransferase family protein [Nocardiopsis sp. LDBS1602]MEC3891260.1 aminoglycoside phosphotransferase family protein [Nocardiopsis sp. LDBS1602]
MGIVETHRDLLGRLLPGDRVRDLVVHEGQFHHVVVGSDRVVRLARTAAAADRLPATAVALRTLAGIDLDFGVPRALLVGSGTSPGEPSYLVMSRIPGAPLVGETLTRPEVLEAVAEQYAALLSGLAAAGAGRAVLPEVSADRWREFADRWREFAARVRAELFPLMSPTGRERAERELGALDVLPYLTTAVVHGDLGAENVLWEWVRGVPRLSGVVDWDEVALGDPADGLAGYR